MDGERPTHKVKATECGKARVGDGLAAQWERVTCPGCANHRPVTHEDMVARGWPVVCHTPHWPPEELTCGRALADAGGVATDWPVVSCRRCLLIGAQRNPEAARRLRRAIPANDTGDG